MVRRTRHAPVWRSRARASARLVGHFRRWCLDRSIALDLRPHRETNRPGSNWAKGRKPESGRIFFCLTKICKLTTEGFLVHHAAKRIERLPRPRTARLDLKRFRGV